MKRIPGLDGLRAISILMVLAGHYRHRYALVWLGYFGDIANLGVRIFFVISGFLITSLLLKELRSTGTISIKEFYYRRTLRIFPAFYAFLLVMWIASRAGIIQLIPGDLFHGLTYTMNYHYDRAWWLGHIWSLSVEEQFYLLWPATLLLLGKNRGLKAAAAVVVLAPVLRLGIGHYWPSHVIDTGEAFPTIADTIATGCLLAGFHDRIRSSAAYSRLVDSKLFVLVPLCALVLNVKSGGRIKDAILFTIINLCIALCVSRTATRTTGLASVVLNWSPIAFIGALSYSLYLWQQPFYYQGHSAVTSFPLNVVLVFGFALASHYGVERPFLSLRDKNRKRNKAAVVAVGTAS